MVRAAIALATLFFFGCQTVQVRAGPGLQTPPPPALRVALAEPELDLWIEGSGQVTPQEADQGLRAARAALGSALDRRGFAAAGEAEEILVVREQAVARTEGRRGAQTAAIVGIVLVVAAIVVLIVASSRSGSSRSPHAGPAGPARAAPPRAVVPRAPAYYPAPVPWFGWGVSWGVHLEVPLAPPPPWAPVVAPTLEARLPARGFFAGDETEIVLELRDARSGEVVWSRAARDEIDPRDPAAVRSLVDRMLAGEPWAAPLLQPASPVGQPAPPPAPPPPAAPAREPPRQPQKPPPPRVERALA
jgi:hypothetical protein